MLLAGATVEPGRGAARSEHRLRVAAVEPAARDVLLLRFEDPSGAELPPWQAGDHLELVLPSALIRHYSLCGQLDERGSYTVAVLRVADGRGGSIEIHDSDLVGTKMLVRGPRSNFPLVDAPSYLLLAGGIGITPLFAMAQSLARACADWSLVYGAGRRMPWHFVRSSDSSVAIACVSSLRTPTAYRTSPRSSTPLRPARRCTAAGRRR